MGIEEDVLLDTGVEKGSIFMGGYNPKIKKLMSFQFFVPKVAVFFRK